MFFALVQDKKWIKRLKDNLELHHLLHPTLKITQEGDWTRIPLSQCSESDIPEFVRQHSTIIEEEEPQETDSKVQPKLKYSVYPPMALLVSGQQVDGQSVQSLLSTNVTHVAINSPIIDATDVVRRPKIIPVHGDFGPEPTSESISNPTENDFDSAFWATCVQHGVHQTWAPRYTMFSRGNIKEKNRVLTQFNDQKAISDSIVVDLYAGIGYFSLCYAMQKPTLVLCWEINPWSVQGFARGARKNGINVRVIRHGEPFQPLQNDRIVIFLEDNCYAFERLSQITSIPQFQHTPISHVNMGLLPDCRLAWDQAMKIAGLSPETTVLHVHENVAADQIESYSLQCADELSKLGQPGCSTELLHTERVKTFAPGVWHVVMDIAATNPIS